MSFRTTINGRQVDISEELLERYDRPGPRYTSYPTAPIWNDGFGPSDLASALAGSSANVLSLYIHIPFCERRCHFCGCSTIATSRHDIARRYIETVSKEMAIFKGYLGNGKEAVQVHLGGGTPTFLSCPELTELWKAISSNFAIGMDAEIGIEIDPRVTTFEQLDTLKDLGFNRISLGLQDVSDKVQEAIGRIEPLEHVRAMIDRCRALNFKSVNLDMVYGLPFQTEGSFNRTITELLRLSPDRIALFNFAYLPKMLPHQRRIPANTLPSAREKFRIFCMAIEELGKAGYDFIGMDHFAKKNDELSIAAKEGTLWRNFQGYTTKSGTDLLGLGLTAISDANGCYAQNEKKLINYHRKIGSGSVATIKGWKLSDDDMLRRRAIRDLFCNGVADISGLRSSLPALRSLENDGLVEISGDNLKVAPLGRLFIRNIAMTFDGYLDASEGRFSRTV